MTVALPSRSRSGDDAAPRLRLGPMPGEATNTFTLLSIVSATLIFFGLVMVLSASSVEALETTRSPWSFAVRQGVWALLGTVGMAVALWSDRTVWRRLAPYALGAVVVLLLLVLVPGIGIGANGARRWLGAGPVQLQPSELAKLAVILFVARLLADRSREMATPLRTLWPVLGVFGAVAALILVQPNLGTTLVLAAIVVAMLHAACARMGALVGIGTVLAAGAAALVWFEPYRRRRLLAMFDPWSNKSDSGYQAIQAGVGLGDGGLTGVGLGQSRAKWGYLPYAHNDFIFAIIGEELGLLGALFVVGLFVAIAFLGVRAATRASDRFSALVATGITTWFVAQAFLNIGVVIGLLPNTGVPLPFISYGGSSLLVTMIGLGMLLNIARHPRPAAARPR